MLSDGVRALCPTGREARQCVAQRVSAGNIESVRNQPRRCARVGLKDPNAPPALSRSCIPTQRSRAGLHSFGPPARWATRLLSRVAGDIPVAAGFSRWGARRVPVAHRLKPVATGMPSLRDSAFPIHSHVLKAVATGTSLRGCSPTYSANIDPPPDLCVLSDDYCAP